jgi:adenine-specific DNA-methyltransferase
MITGPPADDRDFIQRTFDGLYFTADDRAFLDSAWSHIAVMSGFKRALAIAALILAAARKQPRGVFTVTDLRYDDGRRDLHLALRQHFIEAVEAYNGVVFKGTKCRALHGDVLQLDAGCADVVYLDPPYAPPKDDNCYIKRYHFLEGLAVYWQGLTILDKTKTKKLEKLYTHRSPTSIPSSVRCSRRSSGFTTRRSCSPIRPMPYPTPKRSRCS